MCHCVEWRIYDKQLVECDKTLLEQMMIRHDHVMYLNESLETRPKNNKINPF